MAASVELSPIQRYSIRDVLLTRHGENDTICVSIYKMVGDRFIVNEVFCDSADEAWYGAAYALMKPLYPLLKIIFPNYVTTTECVGRAMLNITKRGFPNPVLENRDINRMCAKES